MEKYLEKIQIGEKKLRETDFLICFGKFVICFKFWAEDQPEFKKEEKKHVRLREIIKKIIILGNKNVIDNYFIFKHLKI